MDSRELFERHAEDWTLDTGQTVRLMSEAGFAAALAERDSAYWRGLADGIEQVRRLMARQMNAIPTTNAQGWNRYDTGTYHKLHVWSDGESYDVEVPMYKSESEEMLNANAASASLERPPKNHWVKREDLFLKGKINDAEPAEQPESGEK